MLNGDSLLGDPCYNQMAIVPFPQDSSKFYLFHLSVSTLEGFRYSIIDMTLDSGKGAIIQKNISVTDTELFSGMTAIKNGNGRDWWVIYHNSNASTGGLPTNDFYVLSITPFGIQGPFIQSIGELSSSDAGSIKFSHKGDKLIFINAEGLIDLFVFDRCTGIISNHLNIMHEFTPYPAYFGCEFSSNDSILYISTAEEVPKILQFDLSAANIASTEDTVAAPIIPAYSGGYLSLAPDNKIYWSRAATYYMTYNYPYPDTAWAFEPVAMNLSVINNPNSLGASCNFQLNSFYLGGARTYYGLPNNPDYNMPALGGSLCDTLGYPNQVQSIKPQTPNQLNVFYHPDWQTAFINASGLAGRNYGLHIVDITGKEIFSESGSLTSQYYTKDFRCQDLKDGMYLVLFETEKDRLVKKFVKE